MQNDIPMSQPDIDASDEAAVLEVLRSGRLALGPRAAEFERAVAAYCGVRHAVAVSSGTAGLHLVARAMGLGPGDDVLVPSFTFAASVNAILYVGARPVFVEVEPETCNLDLDDLERRMTRRARAILAVDAFGHPADWRGIERLAAAHGLAVIDDCCEALGAAVGGRRVGSFGRAGVFAFYPNKQITTGEGGMIVTDDGDLAALCRSYANQGRDAMGAWLHHQRLGYNYRLDEMSAALGVSQMRRIDAILAKRQRVADLYGERIARLDRVRPPVVHPWATISWFVYVVTLAEGLDRDAVIGRLARAGIPARGYFEPVHLQPYIRDCMGDLSGTLPRTEALARRTLALPFHGGMREDQVDRVVAALSEALGAR